MARILIVDDDPHMRLVCARALIRVGHTVVCVESGDLALREVAESQHNFDVVLLDRLMPGLSGLDTLAGLKALAPNLPVIIITGGAAEGIAAEALQRGATDCLPKPFNPEQLRNAVQRALRGD